MKVAAVQMDVTILEKEKNLEKILGNLETAASAGAELAVFPECALSGYCSTRGGRTVVFSILMNGVNVVGARAIQDRMTQAIAGSH